MIVVKRYKEDKEKCEDIGDFSHVVPTKVQMDVLSSYEAKRHLLNLMKFLFTPHHQHPSTTTIFLFLIVFFCFVVLDQT